MDDNITTVFDLLRHGEPAGGPMFRGSQDDPLSDTGWQHWQKEAAGKRVLVVCHGGVIRMILAEVMGIPLERSFSALAVPYACRSRIRIDESGHGVLSCLQSHGSPSAF